MMGKITKFNIVIYGCDNTGKTTLAHSLMEELGGTQYDAIYTKSLGPAPIYEQIDFLDKHIHNKSYQPGHVQVEIMDRFPIIEEFVCGNIIRNKNQFDGYNKQSIGRYLDSVNMFIHCCPGMKQVNKWGTREQMDGVKENAYALYSMYEAVKYVFPGMGDRTLEYDFTNPTHKNFVIDVVDHVCDFFEGYKSFLKWGGQER